jgi:hypothetical protein
MEKYREEMSRYTPSAEFTTEQKKLAASAASTSKPALQNRVVAVQNAVGPAGGVDDARFIPLSDWLTLQREGLLYSAAAETTAGLVASGVARDLTAYRAWAQSMRSQVWIQRECKWE